MHALVVTDKVYRERTMVYEPGMQIIFDMVSGMAIVEFREKIKTLGPFKNQKEANLAGERYCRDHGWIDRPEETVC